MKICLIGNNLTSVILARILSTKKLYIDVFSTNLSDKKFKTRTLGLSAQNYDFLNSFNKDLKKKTNIVSKINVIVDNNKIKEKITFNDENKPLFHMIKYDDLFLLIKKDLIKNKFVSFKKIKEYNLLSLNKQKYSLIINCETSNILGKKFLKNGIFKKYNNIAFTTIIKHSKIKNNSATQVFTQKGPIAYLPLSNISTSVVYSRELKKKEIITNDYVKETIEKFNPLYNIYSIEKLQKFNLNLKLPRKYYSNKILFFGDAIHSIHPLAGQGFNMTIRDIRELITIINKKIDLGLSIDKSIYNEFEKQTKTSNTIFSLGVDLIYQSFKISNSMVPSNFSKNIISLINQNQKFKKIGIDLANKGLRL